MNYPKKLLVLTLLIVSLSFLKADLIPEQNQDLIKGFFDGVGFRSLFNVTSCGIDFDTFFLSSLEDLNGLEFRSNGENIVAFSKTLEIFGALVDRCEGVSEGFTKLLKQSIKAFYNPGVFLAGGVRNVVSVAVVTNYIKLTALISTGYYYDAGKAFGEIIYGLLDVDL